MTFVLGAELPTSDFSRSAVEKILHRTSKRKSCRQGKKIIKVNNPPKMLERYERYREEVKKTARKFTIGTRVMMDGNEILKFYYTTVNCRHKNKRTVTQLSDDPTCGVCMTIESKFRIDDATRKVRRERTKLGGDKKVM